MSSRKPRKKKVFCAADRVFSSFLWPAWLPLCGSVFTVMEAELVHFGPTFASCAKNIKYWLTKLNYVGKSSMPWSCGSEVFRSHYYLIIGDNHKKEWFFHTSQIPPKWDSCVCNTCLDPTVWLRTMFGVPRDPPWSKAYAQKEKVKNCDFAWHSGRIPELFSEFTTFGMSKSR